MGQRIEQGIEERFGVRTVVILRTIEQWRSVMNENPFAGRELDPAKLLVTFFDREPQPDALKNARMIRAEPEELQILRREAYTYFPNGMARPKLSWAAVEKTLGVAATGRNWNSVVKILELAEALEK